MENHGHVGGDEDYEELCEPKFKYKRIPNDVTKIFASDAASCIAVHPKFLAVGTQRGRVYVFDHGGDLVAGKNIPPHAVDVNHISIDASGEYLGSCANDGKIVIYGLCGDEYNQIVSLDRPVRSVALDPQFSRSGSGHQFVTGDRCLILHEKGFLTKNKQQVVYIGKERDGWIHNISWKGPYVAFANDVGVRIYDKGLKTIITHILRKHDITLRCELFPARIAWFDESNLVVAWADTVTVCAVKETQAYLGPDLPNKLVEIVHMWELPQHYASGVSFTTPTVAAGSQTNLNLSTWQELVLFCTSKAKDTGDTAAAEEEVEKIERPQHPRVLLVEPLSLQEYSILTEDIIEMNDCEKVLRHQYHLAGVTDENLYFLLATHDLIQVKPCNDDDHVGWLLDNQLYKKALDFAKERADRLITVNVSSVGRQYLDYLIGQKRDYEEAAKMCVEVCARRKDLWEEYVTKFEQHGRLKQLAKHVPTHDPQLEPECYQSILTDFLKDDAVGFKEFVCKWSPDLYRTGALINDTLNRLYKDSQDSDTHRIFLSTLAQLYTYERNYDRALAIYMKLRDKAVFQTVDRYQLFPLVKDRIQDLMNIDTDLAVRLLLENGDSLPSTTVMTQLSRQPKLQLAYLDKLFARGEGMEFADLAINLYAEYNRPRLLPFLRNSEHYKLDKALEICRARQLGPECVFLLGRGGNRAEALKFIINELRNINQAIDFCKEHDDVDLWRDLINYGVKRADFATILMRNIGTHVDPTLLIRQIATKMEIPDLRDSLIKLLKDYSLQIDLQTGCRSVLLADCFGAAAKLVSTFKSAVQVRESDVCRICGSFLIISDPRYAQNIVICLCKHVFHRDCFTSKDSQCPQCTA